MDDHSFDQWIKGKLDRYEDPTFDSGALAGFHEQMAAGTHTLAWYQAPVTHYLVAASLTLFTVVNAWLFWPASPAPETASTTPDTQHQLVIDSLTRVIEETRTHDKLVTDSVTVYYQNKVNNLQGALIARRAPSLDQNGRWYAGNSSAMPTDLYDALKSQGLLHEDKGQVYLTTETAKPIQRFTFNHEMPTIAQVYDEPAVELDGFKWQNPDEQLVIRKQKRVEVSSKTRKLIEKHYTRGIGISVAPNVELAGSSFTQGSGGFVPRAGFTVDWILSPSLSVETGASYSKVENGFTKETLMPVMPGVNYGLGDLEGMTVTNQLISAPVSLKYRQWLSEKNQGIVKAGYTPYFSAQEKRSYSYDLDFGGFNPGGGPPHQGPDRRRVTEIETANGMAFYGGTWSLSAGLTHQLKKGKSLEASLFYENSLGVVGQQNLSMQMMGVKAAYWFNLR